MSPFMNPVLLRILLLVLHLIPPSTEGNQVILVQEAKLLGTYSIVFMAPGQYEYRFSGDWEEGKRFTAERSFLYSYLYTVYPNPREEGVAVNLLKELETLMIPEEGNRTVVGEGDTAVTLVRVGSLFLIGSESANILCIVPVKESK
ncbi:MAG: hypothetical protein Kow009_06180 [Spirochaetales bacterium]